ncbi:MAG: hypothetical protein ACREKN_01415 [Longimicrobiaceae bacterium]
MTRTRLLVGVLSLAALLAGCATAGVPERVESDVTALDLGRRYTGWYYRGDLDRLWERFTPEMRDALDREELAEVRDRLTRRLGREAELLDERVERGDDDFRLYLRTVRFDRAPERAVLLFAIDGEGRIGGFYIRPAG